MAHRRGCRRRAAPPAPPSFRLEAIEASVNELYKKTQRPGDYIFVDNARMALAAWACEATCFANNPQPDLSEGLGELEIKAEPIRFVTCATSDLL